VGSLSQFEEYAGPLLRGQLSAGKGVGGIGFFKAVEDADYFLHNLILLRLFDCFVAEGLGSRERRRGEIVEEVSRNAAAIRFERFRGFHRRRLAQVNRWPSSQVVHEGV
jgi:hypothetical protein